MPWPVLVVPALLAIIAVAYFVVRRRRIYRPLFTHEHYNEVAGLLVALRESALDELKLGATSDSAPPALVSSAGLALSYSIARNGELFVHHFAISLPAHRTPHAVGDRFAHFLANRLGLPTDQVRLGASQSTVHHMEFDADRKKHYGIATLPIGPPSESELEELRLNKRRIPCHPMDVSDTPN